MNFLSRLDKEKIIDNFSEGFVNSVLTQMEPFIDSSIYSLEEAMGGIHEYEEWHQVGMVAAELEDTEVFEEFVKAKEICREQMIDSMREALQEQVTNLLPKVVEVILSCVEEELNFEISEINLS